MIGPIERLRGCTVIIQLSRGQTYIGKIIDYNMGMIVLESDNSTILINVKRVAAIVVLTCSEEEANKHGNGEGGDQADNR